MIASGCSASPDLLDARRRARGVADAQLEGIMPTTLPLRIPATNALRMNEPSELFTGEFFAIALFSGIGLFISLIAAVCGEQGIWL
jgi:hypothetical protein